MKARKGDLAVLCSQTVTFCVGSPSTVREQVEVCRVLSATRDGLVKTLRPIRYSGGSVAVGQSTVLVVPAARVLDWNGLEAAVRAHCWPGHPDSPMPFDSLLEARETVRPFIGV